VSAPSRSRHGIFVRTFAEFAAAGSPRATPPSRQPAPGDRRGQLNVCFQRSCFFFADQGELLIAPSDRMTRGLEQTNGGALIPILVKQGANLIKVIHGVELRGARHE